MPCTTSPRTAHEAGIGELFEAASYDEAGYGVPAVGLHWLAIREPSGRVISQPARSSFNNGAQEASAAATRGEQEEVEPVAGGCRAISKRCTLRHKWRYGVYQAARGA